MSKTSSHGVTGLIQSLQHLQETYDPIHKLLHPDANSLSTKRREFMVSQARCDQLSAEEQKSIFFFGNTHPHNPITLGHRYIHHYGNSSIYYNSLIAGLDAHFPAKPDEEELSTRCLEEAFEINQFMTHAGEPWSNQHIEKLPYIHCVAAYNVLGVMFRMAKISMELDVVKDIIPAHQESLLQYIEQRQIYTQDVINSHPQRALLAKTFTPYTTDFIPGLLRV